MTRQYEETHPWITFRLAPQQLDLGTWMLLGELISKAEHLAGAPLKPGIAEMLDQLYLSKSAHATTQIEGNTLSEEEVLKRVKHQLPLPPSQEYLGQEIDNIVAAYDLVMKDLEEGRPLGLTRARLEELNRLVLTDVPIEDGVVPGKIRMESVLVGNLYRGAPAEDCEYLVERLCAELEGFRRDAPEQIRPAIAVLSALYAHLYIAWIHPFGDGNGRTARLAEFQLLAHAGIPTLAAHLPSDFYMRTRSMYYQVLQRTSRLPYPWMAFIDYALQGFVEELREQIKVVQEQQMVTSWQNFIHEVVRDGHGATCTRQRHLMLDLPPDRFTPISKIPELTPRLAAEYAGKTRRTVARDVNALERLGLIVRGRAGVRPYMEQMQTFLPRRANVEE